LRTPLAELRTLAEVALKWPGDIDATDTAFHDVLAIARRMETTVTALLVLARGEAGQLAIHSEPVALAEFLNRIWSPLAAQAARKQTRFPLDVLPQLNLHPDPTLLGHVVGNLLGNAVEYSKAGGQVQVHAAAHDGHVDLAVTNTTDELTVEDLPHILERFWRK